MNGQRPGQVRHVVPVLVASVPRAAKQLGVCELTVRRHVRDGRIKAVLVGGTWRIPRDDQRLVQQLPIECSIQEVANSLDVSEVTVRRWIRSGAIPAKKVGKCWKVPRRFLEMLLDGEEQVPAPVRPFGEESLYEPTTDGGLALDGHRWQESARSEVSV